MGRKKKDFTQNENGAQKKDISWERVIQDCTDCYATCMSTYYYVLGRNSSKRKNGLLSILLDCAEACLMAARLLFRKSRYYIEYTRLCMMICEEAYGVFNGYVEDMQLARCARMCLQCSKSCRRISNIG